MKLLLFCFIPLFASEIAIHIPQPKDSPERIHAIEHMMDYFFKGNGVEIRDEVRPYLQARLNKTKRLSKIAKIDAISSSARIDEEIASYINKTVSKAIEAAYIEEKNARLRYQEEAHQRYPKTKVVLITSITSIITALIGAGITIAVSLTT